MNEHSHSTHTHATEEDVRNRDIRIWVNGDIVHRDDAKVSVYDAGFMLGDGMWEGMRLYNGKWAFFDAHMDRLYGSCKAAGIDIGMSRDEMLAALNRTAEANAMVSDAHVRLMVTRGLKDKPFQHPRLSTSGPTVVILIEHSVPKKDVQKGGVRLVTVPQVRGMPMAQDAKYNSHSKLNCVLACLECNRDKADRCALAMSCTCT